MSCTQYVLICFDKGLNKDCLLLGILDLSPLVYCYISSTVEKDLLLYGGRRNLLLFSRNLEMLNIHGVMNRDPTKTG